MNLLRLATSALGGASTIVNTASTLATVVGAIYLVDCRLTSRSAEARDSCYFTALPLMGVGAAGKGGFAVGYNTLNPAQRAPEHEGTARDAHGRFTKREG